MKRCPDCRHALKRHGAMVKTENGAHVFLGCRAVKKGKYCRCARVA